MQFVDPSPARNLAQARNVPYGDKLQQWPGNEQRHFESVMSWVHEFVSPYGSSAATAGMARAFIKQGWNDPKQFASICERDIQSILLTDGTLANDSLAPILRKAIQDCKKTKWRRENAIFDINDSSKVVVRGNQRMGT